MQCGIFLKDNVFIVLLSLSLMVRLYRSALGACSFLDDTFTNILRSYTCSEMPSSCPLAWIFRNKKQPIEEIPMASLIDFANG